MHPVVLGLFILEAILYGLIGYALWRTHTAFPDTRLGYHVGEAMASQSAWEYANRAAGAVCGGVGTVLLAAGLLLWRLEAGLGLAIGAFAPAVHIGGGCRGIFALGAAAPKGTLTCVQDRRRTCRNRYVRLLFCPLTPAGTGRRASPFFTEGNRV